MVKTLINKKRQAIIGIDRDIWYKYVHNPDNRPIIESLSNGPLIIDEIHSDYNKNERIQKSISSIYRYLNDLLDEKIIIKAGRLFQSPHTSSKVLYDLSAEIIIPERPEIKIWSSDDNREKLALCIGTILDRHFHHKRPSVQLLEDIFYRFETERYQGLRNALNELVKNSKSDEDKKELIKIINTSDPYITAQSLELFSLIHWIMQKKDLNCILEKLTACYLDTNSSGDTRNSINENQNSSSSDFSYSDYVEYTPILVQTLDEVTWETLVWNYNHRAILLLLRKPMTLNEIHKEHHNAVLTRIEEDKKVGKKITNIPRRKKKSTIYNYLQIMKDGGLIVEAGRRIREGKALTEILYVRKALYVSKEKAIKDFKSKNWNKIIELVGSLLVHANAKKDYDHLKFRDLITNMEKFKANLFTKEYIQVITNPPTDVTANFEFEQHNAFFEAVRLLEWFLALEDRKLFLNQLLNCFSD
ncbi:MAG: hypothetical protein JSW11_11940 [Candidatus Heimdallarchaeota archaeon]|nr:MAG: hypothetical protein JSW11_11940 [Candidatus Heimdallarchaeota archaeon]